MFFKKLFKRKLNEIDYGNIPVHIAIIPDGNGRWAKKRAMPRSFGHREGANTLKKIVKFCNKIGIKYMTAYTFSTENWSRPKNEVDTLMSLLLDLLKNTDKELSDSNIRIRVIGDTNALSVELQSEISRVVKSTSKNSGMCLIFALNYGSKDEIVFAFKNIATKIKSGRLKVEDINEELISESLYTAGIPDPDLLIRTGGENRISNYLLWQLSYSEFWFSDVLWPDFGEEEVIKAIKGFQNRNRRYGGV